MYKKALNSLQGETHTYRWCPDALVERRKVSPNIIADRWVAGHHSLTILIDIGLVNFPDTAPKAHRHP